MSVEAGVLDFAQGDWQQHGHIHMFPRPGSSVESPLLMPADDPDPDKKKSPWVQFGRYSQLAFMLPAGTVAGYLVGALLDKWLHQNWIAIVGLLLGTAGGLIEVIRTAARDTKE